jgi:serine/threonine protein phosphatase PrpC
MTIRSYGDTYAGRRPNNEDALGKREPTDPILRVERGCLYIAADGMGGHAAGEIASRLAVETILSEYYADKRPPQESLVGAIREASRRIYHIAGDSIETDGMGCTVVASAVLPGSAIIAHVGDSRAYRLREGELTLLTQDHHVNEGGEQHVLSRAVGVRADVEVTVNACTLEPGDRLLLCTDGVSNAVPDADLSESLRQPTPADAIHTLIQCAINRKADDNSSAIVVELLVVAEPAAESAAPDATEIAPTANEEPPGTETITPYVPEQPVPSEAPAEPPIAHPLAESAATPRRGLWRLFGRRSG